MAGDDEMADGRLHASFPNAIVYRLYLSMQRRSRRFRVVLVTGLLTAAWLLGTFAAAVADQLELLDSLSTASSSARKGEALPVGVNEAPLPYYDILAVICAPADVHALDEALQTWLHWTPQQSNWSFQHVFVICSSEDGAMHLASRKDVALVTCEEKLAFPQEISVSRAAQGYKYVSNHFKFTYLLKAELAPGVSLDCVEQNIRDVNKTHHEKGCPSFGLGRWYQARTAKVWLEHEEPYGKEYHNALYRKLVGSDVYAPYMSGWAFVFTADVAQFLGMFGHDMPRWRNFWRIEDAAFGSYMIGVDICRVELMCDPIGETHDAPPTETTSHGPTLEALERVMGFYGPIDDDVAGIGDLANMQVVSLQQCGYTCIMSKRCVSFEYSPTATAFDDVKNCQLASTARRTGLSYKDFKLYVRDIPAH